MPDRKIFMVERESLELNVFFGILMAGGAIAQGENPLLPFRMFEVTEETGAFGHLDVRAYDDLGVAARAAQLFAAPEVSQMKLVIEENPLFEGKLLRQKTGGMAIGPQATGVLDLGVGLGAVLLGHELDDGIDRLELDPEGFPGLWRIMTVHAGDLVVLGGLPGVIIGIHDVAAVAEGGAGGVIKQIDEDPQKYYSGHGQHFIKLGMEMEMDSNPFQKFFDSIFLG